MPTPRKFKLTGGFILSCLVAAIVIIAVVGMIIGPSDPSDYQKDTRKTAVEKGIDPDVAAAKAACESQGGNLISSFQVENGKPYNEQGMLCFYPRADQKSK